MLLSRHRSCFIIHFSHCLILDFVSSSLFTFQHKLDWIFFKWKKYMLSHAWWRRCTFCSKIGRPSNRRCICFIWNWRDGKQSFAQASRVDWISLHWTFPQLYRWSSTGRWPHESSHDHNLTNIKVYFYLDNFIIFFKPYHHIFGQSILDAHNVFSFTFQEVVISFRVNIFAPDVRVKNILKSLKFNWDENRSDTLPLIFAVKISFIKWSFC